ncbi:hypothetical protein [Cohnella pontilimi]|nr:hypothetical protein [Cohnella pontilimi]
MQYLILALLLIAVVLLLNINAKLPRRDYVEEEVNKALRRDAERRSRES